TRLGNEHDYGRIREAHDIQLCLADADRLDQHHVAAVGVEQPDDVAGGPRDAAVAPAARQAPYEYPRVEEMTLHADAIAEHGAAAERTGRIDRDHPDLLPEGPEARGQTVGERR